MSMPGADASLAREPCGEADAPTLRPRQPLARPPGLVVVGASTGGPQALVELLATLAPILPLLPVCVTLHMPAELMPVVAAHVAKKCRVETTVVLGDRPLERGLVHFAPGDRHFDFLRTASGVTISLTAAPSKEYCKPAIDVMFAAAARSHGARTLGIVLSGMGKDGLQGARAIVAAGGCVLVQDKLTSAVWGMPGAVAKAALASAILDPAALGRDVIRRLGVAANA